MNDTELLEAYGWRVEARETRSGDPLQIRYEETNSRAFGKEAVGLVIEALRARRNEYEEQERRLDAFGRL